MEKAARMRVTKCADFLLLTRRDEQTFLPEQVQKSGSTPEAQK